MSGNLKNKLNVKKKWNDLEAGYWYIKIRKTQKTELLSR